jgi:hypothetical protein
MMLGHAVSHQDSFPCLGPVAISGWRFFFVTPARSCSRAITFGRRAKRVPDLRILVFIVGYGNWANDSETMRDRTVPPNRWQNPESASIQTFDRQSE